MDGRSGVVIILSLLLFSSCGKESACGHSYGDELMDPVRIWDQPFTEAEFDLDAEVILKNADSYYVEVEGGENEAQFVRVNDENGVITITSESKCHWLRHYDQKVKVKVYAPDLLCIRNLGVATVKTEEALPWSSLCVHQNGTGNVELAFEDATTLSTDMYVIGDVRFSGKTAYLDGIVASFGHLRAEELEAQEVRVSAIHEGDAHVQPVNKLTATCTQSGDIYYYREPNELIVIESEEGHVEYKAP